MSKYTIVAVLAWGACGPAAGVTSMPWLSGFTPSATGHISNPAVSARMSELIDDGDDDDESYGGIQLTADVATAQGVETVLVSYHHGIIVTDRGGHVVARAPGFDRGGSADDVLAVAAGDGHIDAPVIAVAVNIGGHRESTTSIALYRVGHHGQLDQLFMAAVEEHDGDQTFTGSIALQSGGLVYRAPRAAAATLWTFETKRGRYIERQPPAVRRSPDHLPSHVEPSTTPDRV